jgi:hypothetical protein
MRKWLWGTGIILLLAMGMALLSGCAVAHHTSVPDSIPAVGGALERTDAHVQSADRLVDAAKPESNSMGKALLQQAQAEHAAAEQAIDEAKAETANVAQERDKLEDMVAQRDKRITEVTSGWGYRFQVWVTRLLWTLVAIVSLHFVLGIAGLFIAGPFGGIIAKAGVLLNPMAWFQSARDNYYFRKQAPTPCP